jgi:recombination protein RecR
MYPESIQKVITLLSRFPTVGQRTASRFALYLLRAPKEDVQELLHAIADMRTHTGLCSFCFDPYDNTSKETLCTICKDTTRDQTTLCVVERESDLQALERTKQYHGRYFILGGTVGSLRKQDIEKLRMQELQTRVPSFKEVILATNLTTEGEATALYLERTLQSLAIKTSRLGRGLPIGGELEYADEETIRQSLESRR